MSKTTVGLLVGLILGIVAYFGTFLAFLVVTLFGAAGLVVGLILDNKLDLGTVLGSSSSRR
ncbi:hypothetical protein [Brevibacterium gallinarum]|uniref:DUF2273 domain-containing protein n=1 Tax=Brevibacterium gallinarum TaxID=2762220 RepID=A0ABR8WRS0_9MICO|nr:hypothetical protein [Brevibacterium gallinarum]MBD8019763.1 hypothetical protein [Brevibacterium gallinarum]